MERLRVAVVITRFMAGAGGVALRGALALEGERFEPVFFTAHGGALTPVAREAGVEVVELAHMRPEISLLEDLRGVRELTEYFGARRFDVVHTHSAKAGAIGRIAATRAGIQATVHTLHGFPFHDFQSVVRRRAYITVEARLGRITSHFLAIGGQVAADAIRLGLATPERITVSDSAVDPGIPLVTHRTRLAARRVLRIPPGMKVVGTVGRLDEQKSPLDMVDAVAALRRDDVYFVWIGAGPLLESARARAVRRGLGDRFAFVGQRDDVFALLPAFDVFAMSSLYEGIPCSVVEAIVAGLPVVATAVNAVPEVVVPGRTGLLARAGDPDSIARGIDFLLRNPEKATAMALNARAAIRSRFGVDGLRRDLVHAYGAAAHLPSDTAVGTRLGIKEAI